MGRRGDVYSVVGERKISNAAVNLLTKTTADTQPSKIQINLILYISLFVLLHSESESVHNIITIYFVGTVAVLCKLYSKMTLCPTFDQILH